MGSSSSCISKKKIGGCVYPETPPTTPEPTTLEPTTLEPINDVILSWKARTTLYKYHWWPMKECKHNSYYNNLYANNGGLCKYDQLFLTNSLKYQKENYFRSSDSGDGDNNWAGFCDKAAILSCLYKYPVNDVIVEYNNKIITFTPHDIEALMILSTNNTIKNNIKLFFGERNNEINDKNKQKSKDEPFPSDLLHMLQIFCKSNEPFIMDYDSGHAVWNFSYDGVTVYKTSICGINHDLNLKGKTEYYNFKITSSVYPDNNMDIWGYVNNENIEDNNGYHNKKKEGWISNNHPDFIWKVYSTDSVWKGKSKINPEIDAETVYNIYTHSIRNRNQKLVI